MMDERKGGKIEREGGWKGFEKYTVPYNPEYNFAEDNLQYSRE